VCHETWTSPYIHETQTPPTADPLPSNFSPATTTVWGSFPLTRAIKESVRVHDSQSRSSSYSSEIYKGSTVDVICSTKGENVSDVNGSSDNWDYVATPTVGWVSDEYVNTGGAVAPTCGPGE
jgi:hypothetical protein